MPLYKYLLGGKLRGMRTFLLSKTKHYPSKKTTLYYIASLYMGANLGVEGTAPGPRGPADHSEVVGVYVQVFNGFSINHVE